jgi:Tol biopolymer transport system component
MSPSISPAAWPWIAHTALLATAAHGDASGPRRLAPDALGQDGRITLSPGFAPDGKTMYFAQSECAPIWECPQRLKRSRLGPDGWSRPELVPLPLQGRVDWPSVSPDGRTLLFSWSAPQPRYDGLDIYEDFDLYTLDLTTQDAVPIAIEGADINRPRAGAVRKLRFVHNETAPVLTTRGDLYFWTERCDGIGERDVYIAPADGEGGFLTARPLPAPVNSAGRDDGSWVNPDGNLLLLSYDDRGGEGSTDLFVSRRREGAWSDPVNLGPTVNSPYADFAARLTPDGTALVFSSLRPTTPGGNASPSQVWTIPTAQIPELSRD